MTYGTATWKMTMVETTTLRIFERKIIRKIYGPIKEKECWRIRMNKEITDKGKDMVKFTKSLQPRWYGHAKRLQNLRMPKQIARTTTEGTRKGQPCKNGEMRLKRA
jgi:hypothetical protein